LYSDKMRSLVFLPVAAVAVQVLETQQPAHAHVDYDGLRVTLKGIAEQTKSGKIDDLLTEQVRGILKTVEGDLMTALDVDRNNSQTSLNQAVESIRQCDQDRTTYFAEDYYNVLTQTNDARTDHLDCRAEERTKCFTRNSDCDAIDAIVKNINDNMCATPRFADGDSYEVNCFMNCISELMVSYHSDYMTGRALCRSDCECLTTKTSSCHGLQSTFEVTFCADLGHIQTECGAYRACRKTSEHAHRSTEAMVNQEESLFQAQRVALECLLCYGRAILDKALDYSHCDTLPPCSELTDCPTIDYPPPPDYIVCNEVHEKKPCEDDTYGPVSFEHSEYRTMLDNEGELDLVMGEISRNMCVPATDMCTQCLNPRKGELGDESLILSLDHEGGLVMEA